jgi:hypothetical protein
VEPTRIAAAGAWGTVEWALDSSRHMPAREVYLSLSPGDRAKMDTLFKNLAEVGRITNREKFRNLGDRAGARARSLFEFKSFQIRFLGDFRRGARFLVAHGITNKKKDDLPRADIERTVRILEENDVCEAKERGR